jgi:hypothetical protein
MGPFGTSRGAKPRGLAARSAAVAHGPLTRRAPYYSDKVLVPCHLPAFGAEKPLWHPRPWATQLVSQVGCHSVSGVVVPLAAGGGVGTRRAAGKVHPPRGLASPAAASPGLSAQPETEARRRPGCH